MTIRKVALMGSPVLSRIAKPVDDPTAPEITRLAEDMRDTLVDLGGSWLAAPQVYESLRLVVHRPYPSRSGILYAMRMDDLSRLEFNAEPGFLAQDVAAGMKVWPVLQDMVDAWPG